MEIKHIWGSKPSCEDAQREREGIESGKLDGMNVQYPENFIQFYYLGYYFEEGEEK